jgi:osmotically-inducible protein OsmY
MRTKKNHHRLGILIGVILTASAGANLLRGDQQDDRIEKAFTSSYIYRTQLKDDDISITSSSGAVTLRGRVATGEDKDLATDIAAALPGVGAVHNQLVVAAQPVEESDGWVALKVRGALLFHRNVSLSGKQIAVHDGIVVLTGSADNEAEKALAEEYAAEVKGVKHVDNELQVASTEPQQTSSTLGEKIDDASITAQIKYTLAIHRSTSALRTEVSTEEGVVTIHGQAKNPAEKDLVTKLVENIKGVKDVRNQMQIQS